MEHKDTFVKYRNYNLGYANNLVLSYIMSFGNTYASNQHISKKLGMSVSSVKRSLQFLVGKDLIVIYNPNGRSRFIKVVKNEPVQIEPQVAQREPVVAHIEPYNQLILSHNKKEYKKDNNKDNNKVISTDILGEGDTIIFNNIDKKHSTNIERVNEIIHPTKKEDKEAMDEVNKWLSERGI